MIPHHRELKVVAAPWFWPALCKAFIFGVLAWFVLGWLFGDHLAAWPRLFLGGILGARSLVFWDGWRARREAREMRDRFRKSDVGTRKDDVEPPEA